MKLVWPTDASRHEAFGMKAYAREHRVQGPLLQLMKVAHAQAAANLALLETKGYTAANLAELEAGIVAFEAAKMAQLQAKSDKIEQTEAYYELVNLVWGYMQQLAAVRDLVFPDNHAHREVYYLYPKNYWKHRKKKKQEETVMEGEKVVIEGRQEVEG